MEVADDSVEPSRGTTALLGPPKTREHLTADFVIPLKIEMEKMMKKYLLMLVTITLALSACSAQSTPQGTEPSPNSDQRPPTEGSSASNPLIGAWKLTAYGSASAPTPAVEGVDAGLTFNEDGTVSGTSGCNGLGGDYSVQGNEITFGEFVSTLMACDDPIMAQEEAAHKVMIGTATYKIEGNTLTITKDDMVLVLTRGTQGAVEPPASSAATLTGTWKVTTYRISDVQSSAVADTEAHLTFNEDGTVAGTSGCNDFGGTYTVEGDQITFKDIVSTLMLCDSPLMEQEEAMQQVLIDTATYEFVDNLLVITNNDRGLVLER
jgi:heat shock protein HslJ